MEHKKSYPRHHTNNELADLIDTYGEAGESNPNLAPLHFTKASLGLTELQRRAAVKYGRWTVVVSALAVTLSFIALYFSYMALREGNKWRDDQIRLLSDIRQHLLEEKK